MLPPLVTEEELVEASRRTRNRDEDVTPRMMKKLHTYDEGSVFHKDDICAVLPKKNVLTQLYDLLNILEALGYVKREGGGKFQWFGPGSDRAAKTLKDLKTFAINNQEEDGSFAFDRGDGKTMTTSMLAEIVMMIFISLGENSTITRHELFSLIFKKDHEKTSTVSLKLPKVLKVFEVLGIIAHDSLVPSVKYRYVAVGTDVESSEFFELEETVKIEADTEDIIIVDEEDLQLFKEETMPTPEKEIVPEASGSWTIRDYAPVTYKSKDQLETSPQNDETQVRDNCYVGLVDVKDEFLEGAD